MSQQDTLPNFSLKAISPGKISIGWINNYDSVKQLNIQRSFDSLYGYKTILSVADPGSKTNGYLDNNPYSGNMFYRLFIQLDKGQFIFTVARRPVRDTTSYSTTTEPQVQHSTVVNTQAPPKNNYISNSYIYTASDGDVKINLPGADVSKYHIKFYDDATGDLLFELKNLKEKSFRLDRTAFYHSGWFMFELMEADKLILKNYIYLSRPF